MARIQESNTTQLISHNTNQFFGRTLLKRRSIAFTLKTLRSLDARWLAEELRKEFRAVYGRLKTQPLERLASQGTCRAHDVPRLLPRLSGRSLGIHEKRVRRGETREPRDFLQAKEVLLLKKKKRMVRHFGLGWFSDATQRRVEQ